MHQELPTEKIMERYQPYSQLRLAVAPVQMDIGYYQVFSKKTVGRNSVKLTVTIGTVGQPDLIPRNSLSMKQILHMERFGTDMHRFPL